MLRRLLVLLLLATLLVSDASFPEPSMSLAQASTGVPEVRDELIVYVPHADDEVLSMGVLIQRQIRAGRDVEVIYYTDGAGSGLCAAKGDLCTANEFRGKPVSDFIAARDSELMASLAALGVTADHVHRYAPPGKPRRRDGTSDPAYLDSVLRHYIGVYPDATHVTMSWVDSHPDHTSSGRALRALVQQGVLPADQALFTMARWWWAYDYPQRTNWDTAQANQMRVEMGYPAAGELLRCAEDDGECLARIHAAVQAYHAPTKIGYRSVPVFLDVTDGDPQILLHGATAARYPATVAVTSAARPDRAGSTVTVAGTVSLPSFGTYPAALDSGAKLASTMRANLVKDPFPAGTDVTVSAADAAGKVVGRVRVPLDRGTFSASLSVPTGAARVTVTTDASPGVASATATVPVLHRAVTIRPSSDTSVSGRTVSAPYGRRVVVQVMETVAGKPAAGVKVSMAPTTPGRGPNQTVTATTGANGVATLKPVLSHSGPWRVTSTAGGTGSLTEGGTTLTARVRPVHMIVRPGQATARRDSRHRAHLTGRLTGRDHRIPDGFLRPATVKVWLHRDGTPRRLLATARSRADGTFDVTVASRHAGTIHYEIIGVPDVYSHVKKAGTVRLR